LFCELALQVLADGGTYAFILPDSLFAPEHEDLRSLLLEKTSLEFICRLGEGVFEGVYRGTVVITGRKKRPDEGQTVQCLRLRKSDRVALSGGACFQAIRQSRSHFVPQARFASDRFHRFDIDVSSKDHAVHSISEQGGPWTTLLDSGRGAEISKNGRVLTCAACGFARPLPKSLEPNCLNCGEGLKGIAVQSIVTKLSPHEDGWLPFIVGEDVCRYGAQAGRWIKTGVNGINYKSIHPVGVPRILVRKTGVGLHAALDSSNSITNQVVFSYTEKESVKFPFSYIKYILGVLNSRTVFAYHMKRGGELEWRSHPYVTQKTLATLPIPVPSEGSQAWKQAKAIADSISQPMEREMDIRIERLVAGLFDLDDDQFRTMLSVIDQAADLEPMRRLRDIPLYELQALKVE
jgi:hypothetical protein